MRVAVIGGGMAGLSCAHALQERGVAVTLFDKGRQPGGRVATRVVGAFGFEHGTPWFSDPFGLPAVSWQGQWVGVPTMAALAAAMAVTDLRQGRHVAYLHAGVTGWTVRHRPARETSPGLISDQDGVVDGPYDRIVLAIPSPQAGPLLAAIGLDAPARIVAQATMTPCWTLMAGWLQPGDGACGPAQDPIEHAILDSARPGRSAAPECWTAHATATWSQAHVNDEPAAVQATLLAALMQMTGRTTAPDQAAVQRWRYARTGRALGQPCLDTGAGLVVCGDWLLGPDVGDAVASGQAASAAIG